MNISKLYVFLIILLLTSSQLITAQGLKRPPNLLIKNTLKDPMTVVHKEQTYYVEDGMWYIKKKNSYILDKAPDGAVLNSLSPKAKEVTKEGIVYHKYKGTYYLKKKNSYTVVLLKKKKETSN